MVKKSLLVQSMRWFLRVSALVCLVLAAALFYLTFQHFDISVLNITSLLISAILLILALIFLMRPPIPKQLRHVESLRLHPDQAPLYYLQPMTDTEGINLPIILTMKLSCRWHIIYALGAIIVIVFLLRGGTYIHQSSFFTYALILLISSAALDGIVTLAAFQRIVVRSDKLTIQHGIIRRSIPWEDARLFTIISINDNEGKSKDNLYELSSTKNILRWTHEVVYSPLFTLSPMPYERYRQLLHETKFYIATKTHLPLRDMR